MHSHWQCHEIACSRELIHLIFCFSNKITFSECKNERKISTVFFETKSNETIDAIKEDVQKHKMRCSANKVTEISGFCYTLKRKSITSPSLTMYSLPSDLNCTKKKKVSKENSWVGKENHMIYWAQLMDRREETHKSFISCCGKRASRDKIIICNLKIKKTKQMTIEMMSGYSNITVQERK